ATCDALSFSSKWLTVNHSACAIHCLTKGYKGGRCVNTICNCRN
uniref:Defensin n=1 Tax=Palomena prasina TaxID=55431 RepID=DEFI_PALPR|nr:RecName: Full=Defensin [Palomena prasina]